MKILILLVGIMLPVISQAMMAPALKQSTRNSVVPTSEFNAQPLKKVLFLGCLICQNLPPEELMGDQVQVAMIGNNKVKLDIYKDGQVYDEFELRQVSANTYQQKLGNGEMIQLKTGRRTQIDIKVLQGLGSVSTYKFAVQ